MSPGSPPRYSCERPLMRVRHQILAIVGALALLGAHISAALAYGNDHIATSSVTILPGEPLSAIIIGASMNPQAIPAHGISGSMDVRVRDERGYATGWTLSVGTRDFSGPSGHLGAGMLTISPQTMSTIQGNPDLSGLEVFDLGPMSTHPAMLWRAADAFGDGHYELTISSTLGLPHDPDSGYLYTVIVNIDGSAP